MPIIITTVSRLLARPRDTHCDKTLLLLTTEASPMLHDYWTPVNFGKQTFRAWKYPLLFSRSTTKGLNKVKYSTSCTMTWWNSGDSDSVLVNSTIDWLWTLMVKSPVVATISIFTLWFMRAPSKRQCFPYDPCDLEDKVTGHFAVGSQSRTPSA